MPRSGSRSVSPRFQPARAMISSDPDRRTAVLHTRDTGEPTATLVRDITATTGPKSNLSLYWPVYPHGQTPQTVEERRADCLGFAAGFMPIDALMAFVFGADAARAVDHVGVRRNEAAGRTGCAVLRLPRRDPEGRVRRAAARRAAEGGLRLEPDIADARHDLVDRVRLSGRKPGRPAQRHAPGAAGGGLRAHS